ncbi:hypothetical protein IWX83_003278 [Flavobacterium sp. CG_9.1]|jgi:hypothetical protein|nr:MULTISPECIES: hypothetical protein [Flavobacterium]MBG6063468.1 hypothetical protein [Flavobacterium sp. CG_9.1]
MKKFIIPFLCIALPSFAQEKKEQKLDLSFSYGISHINYSNYSETSPLKLELPKFGSFLEFNADYKLPKNRFIGVGFAKQQHSKNIDDGIVINSNNSGIVLDNYNNTHTKNFYDIHFRTAFKNNIQFTLGVFFFIENLNTNTITFDDTNTYFVLNNEKNRADNLGLFGSLEYYFKLNSYAELGLKSKLYYSLNGVETIAVLPTLRVKL